MLLNKILVQHHLLKKSIMVEGRKKSKYIRVRTQVSWQIRENKTMWLEAKKGLSVHCLTMQERSSEVNLSTTLWGWGWGLFFCGLVVWGFFFFVCFFGCLGFFKGITVDHCLCGSTSTINLPNSPRTRRDEYSKTLQLLQEILSFNINIMLQLAASKSFKTIIIHIFSNMSSGRNLSDLLWWGFRAVWNAHKAWDQLAFAMPSNISHAPLDLLISVRSGTY